MRMFERPVERTADPEPVLAWRTDRLRDAGCSARLAGSLARDPRYDLHALLDLVDRGCPAELAARILAPLEDPRARC